MRYVNDIIGGAVLIALALLLSLGDAVAGPGAPPKGWYGTIRGLFLFCEFDAKQYVLAAAEGSKTSGKPGFLAAMKTASDSGKCKLWQDPLVAVGESEELGVGHLDETRYRMWAVHVGDANRDGWILYDEVESKVDPTSGRRILDPVIYGVGT